MSGLQLILVRCNASGGLFYSITSKTNAIGTINRNVTLAVSATRFSPSEKKLQPNYQFPAIKEPKCDITQDNFIIKTHSRLQESNDSTRDKAIITLDSLLHDNAKENIKIKSEWLPVGQGLFYSTSKFPHDSHPAIYNKVYTTNFSSSKTNNNSETADGNKDNKVPSEETLENTAAALLQDLTGIFVKAQHSDLYRSDIVFENRINNKIVNGWVNYVQKLGLLRIYAHVRYVFVQLQVRSVRINKEEGVIEVKFCCKGYGLVRMVIEYIPKKLYKAANMSREAPVWFNGISYYYVDEEGKIFRHVLDNKEQDKEKPLKTAVETIKDKVSKLREKGVAPSPAL